MHNKTLFIIVCAIIGCSITFYIINVNIIDSSHIPTLITVDDSGTIYNLKVINPHDTLQSRSVGSDGEIKPRLCKKNILMQQHPVFLIWILLIVTMTTVASGAFPFFISQNIQLSSNFNAGYQKVFLSLLWAIAIVILMIVFIKHIKGLYRLDEIICDFHILFNNGNLIVQGIIGSVFVFLIPALSGMFLVGYSANNLLAVAGNILSIENAARRLNSLNNVLLNSIQYLALIVVLAGLATGALGASVKSFIRIDGFDIFPSEVSYVYGLYFTLFLSLMYIPHYLLLKYQRTRLQEWVGNFQNSGEESDRRRAQNTTELLNTKINSIDQIKIVFTLLAPLISSFLPEHLF